MARPRGKTLLTLRKLGVGVIAGALGTVLLTAGVGFAVRGVELGFPPPVHLVAAGILLVVGFGLLWVSGSLLTERLVVTDEGVFHVQGQGPLLRTVLVGEVDWNDLTEAKLSLKKNTSRGQTTKAYTLVFTRRDGSKLDYLVGVPSHGALMRLSHLCAERGVPADFSS